jgi:hypothetical protein
MKNKVLIVITFLMLISLITFSCCSQTTSSDAQVTTITLERTACHGTCPVYLLTVSDNGTVVFDGREYVKTLGKTMSTIDKAKVAQLVFEFNKINYFSLKDSYQEVTITDQASAITSITTGGKSKTIKHYLGDLNAPSQLKDLENKIDEIVNSALWIK